MPRFLPRSLPRGRGMHGAFPVLFAAFFVQSDRRREQSPIIFSTLRSLAGFTSFFIPQIPIPDTSKLKDKLLGGLPSWTTKSALSTFVKRPQADIIVGILMGKQGLSAHVAFYPKGSQILTEIRSDEEGQDFEVTPPYVMMIDNWCNDMVGDGERMQVTLPVMRYSTEYPHMPIAPGVPVKDEMGSIKLWDSELPYFLVDYTNFCTCEGQPVQRETPPSFSLSEKQIMIDYARSIRHHIEEFIANEVSDRAMIVNETPVVKWMVSYPDCLDSIVVGSGRFAKQEFMCALKDAGYPIEDSDIPPAPRIIEGEPIEYESALVDLPTESRMVEFLTIGLTSLINYANLQSGNSPIQVPALPQEKPFITILDDESYLIARRSIWTKNSRFGIIQQASCYLDHSPVFQQLPIANMEMIATVLAGDKSNPDLGHIQDTQSELFEKIRSFSISSWPESSNWRDLMDTLTRNLNKTDIEMYAMDDPNIVRNGLYVPTISLFAELHAQSPEIQDVVIFDSGRGESEAYQTILRDIHFRKGGISPYEAAEKGLDGPEEYMDPIILDGPDLKKFYDMAVEAGLVKKDDKVDVDMPSDIFAGVDKRNYYPLRVIVPPNIPGQPFQVFGLCNVIATELSRIFIEAVRK